MKKKHSIMFIVGEASGDALAAALAAALRKMSPGTEFEFYGATGGRMRREGVETLVRADDFARVGILEVATALPMFWRVFRKLKRIALERRPDVVVLVDFPDFNLKMATALRRRGLKVIYYVSPQVWAWKAYRVRRIRRDVDLLLTILPFEKEWYAERDVPHVRYVGHPLVEEVAPTLTGEKFRLKHGLPADGPLVALLPGSRRTEIEQILPVLLETACAMARKDPELRFVIPLAPARKMSEAERHLDAVRCRREDFRESLRIVRDETREALKAADAAAVASGTATLEAAITATPMAVVYRVSPLTYRVLRHFISTEHIALVNLIAGRRLARELVQDELTAENLGRELFRLLEPEVNRRVRGELRQVRESLGGGGASAEAARAVLEMIEQ